MRSVPRLVTIAAALSLVAASIDTQAQSVVLPLPPADEQALTGYLGAGVVGAARPSEPILDALAYFPLQERVFLFQITAGSHAGNIQSLSLKKSRRPTGAPAWRFALSPTLAGFVNTESGDILMPSVSDSDEGVVVITTPANPFVLKGIKPGESRAFSQTVAVNYLDDPYRRDYSGQLTGAYTYVGTYQLTVPAGAFDAILVRLDYQGKIGPAHVKDTSWYFFSRGVGVVAMINHEDISAFWIYNVHSTTGKVLAAK